jgi:hypothetical protein
MEPHDFANKVINGRANSTKPRQRGWATRMLLDSLLMTFDKFIQT